MFTKHCYQLRAVCIYYFCLFVGGGGRGGYSSCVPGRENKQQVCTISWHRPKVNWVMCVNFTFMNKSPEWRAQFITDKPGWAGVNCECERKLRFSELERYLSLFEQEFPFRMKAKLYLRHVHSAVSYNLAHALLFAGRKWNTAYAKFDSYYR